MSNKGNIKSSFSATESIQVSHDIAQLIRVRNSTKSLTGFPFKSNLYTDHGIKLVRGINVKEGVLDWNDVAFWPELTREIKKYLLLSGDVVIQMDGSKVGKNYAYIEASDLPLLLLQRVTRLRPANGLNSRFLYYNFASTRFFDWVSTIKTDPLVPHISLKDIENFEIHNFSPSEQTAIAEYLDTKTQAIDKKVSLLEKKIGYYQELRKSLINETVTKGLDKNAELQTNELGFATPKKWLSYRLKDLGALYSGLSGKSGDDFNQDDNPDNKGFIPFTNIANNTYLKRDHLGTVVVYEGEKQNRVRKGDIFFLMSSEGYEDIGKSAALAEDIEETYLNSFCKGYRVNPRKTNPYFLNYLMLSDYYRQLLIVEGKGFTRINLKMEKVNDFLVYIPDTLSVQEEIVKYLDSKLDTIAKIITNIQTQIITLKELRKTLINDVVTGKIKVSHE